jgi:hypothetical protein
MQKSPSFDLIKENDKEEKKIININSEIKRLA